MISSMSPYYFYKYYVTDVIILFFEVTVLCLLDSIYGSPNISINYYIFEEPYVIWLPHKIYKVIRKIIWLL